MEAVWNFLVKPIGDRYDNIKTVGGKDLILNTKVESWKFVNRLAIVVETPLAFDIGIKKGDTVVIHQNVFRTFYNSKGIKKKSRSFFKENLYQLSSKNNNLFIIDLDKAFANHGHKNIQVYADSYVALNGRKSQQFIDPKINLLEQPNGFGNKEWILPFNDEIKGF